MNSPTPYELWKQADGDPDRYKELMIEHGLIIEGKNEGLPCGWGERKACIYCSNEFAESELPPHMDTVHSFGLERIRQVMESLYGDKYALPKTEETPEPVKPYVQPKKTQHDPVEDVITTAVMASIFGLGG